MSEPLQLPGLVPWLALTWVLTLVVALASAAIDEFRRRLPQRAVLMSICDWINTAAMFSVCIVFSELYSRNLISVGTRVFLIAMLVVILLAPRIVMTISRAASVGAVDSREPAGS